MLNPPLVAEMPKIAGEICVTRGSFLFSGFDWRIPNATSVLQKFGDSCQSSPFTFCDGDWTVKMIRLTKTRICLSVHIRRVRRVKTINHKTHIELKLMEISSNGEEHLLLEKKWDADKNTGKKYMDLDLRQKNFSWGDQSEFDLKLTCFFKCYDCKTATPEVLSKYFDSIERDLHDMLISGEDSDVTIKVKDRVFKAHKFIIGARSPVFLAMFRHDMIERNIGIVEIPDSEPEVFSKFLEYLYSGKLKDLSEDNVCSVYYIADKYQVLGAKTECADFMSKNISLETFWNIVTLAMRHEDSELLKSARQFFVDNSKAIIETDGWLSFRQENPVSANHILMTLDPEIYQKPNLKRNFYNGTEETNEEKKRRYLK